MYNYDLTVRCQILPTSPIPIIFNAKILKDRMPNRMNLEGPILIRLHQNGERQ